MAWRWEVVTWLWTERKWVYIWVPHTQAVQSRANHVIPLSFCFCVSTASCLRGVEIMHAKHIAVFPPCYMYPTSLLFLSCKEIIAFHCWKCCNKGTCYEHKFCSDHEDVPKCQEIWSKVSMITRLANKVDLERHCTQKQRLMQKPRDWREWSVCWGICELVGWKEQEKGKRRWIWRRSLRLSFQVLWAL